MKPEQHSRRKTQPIVYDTCRNASIKATIVCALPGHDADADEDEKEK